MKHISDFGQRFAEKSATYDMMERMVAAMKKGPHVILMGAGNPALIPEINQVWRKRLYEILEEPMALEKMLGQYTSCAGNEAFLIALADLFNELYDWNLTEKNIGVTIGAQNANFLLFNMLAGSSEKEHKKIMLPILPEYVSYGDQGITHNMCLVNKPNIDFLSPHIFKYRLKLDTLDFSSHPVSLICLSRPTNPSGNIVTDQEIQQLSKLAEDNNTYLLIDNAYSKPFPNIVYKPFNLYWNEHIILTYSLSKMGLPSTRTGIVIANEEIIQRLILLNSISNLGNTSLGQTLTLPLITNRELIKLSNEYIQPYYEKRCQRAQELVKEYFDNRLNYYIHDAEGTFFLWLWFKDLPITDLELYERLIARDVLIVPGSYFFSTLQKEDPWSHRYECIRMSYCLDDHKLRKGIQIIADEVKKAYDEN